MDFIMLNQVSENYVERAHEMRREFLAHLASEAWISLGKFARRIAVKFPMIISPMENIRDRAI
jgi:hypothetical protein